MTYGLEDIAKIAGVSKSTVSRVINNQPNVSNRTRQKVLEVIRASDYHPNAAARALVTRHTGILSIVIPAALSVTFSDPYFPALVQSISVAANENNYATMLWVGNNAEEEERYCDRILSNGLFDGIIIASAVDDDPLLRRLVVGRLPHVLIGPPQQGVRNFVDVDNRSAACEAVTHLVKLGCKRIATVTGPLHTGAARERLAGYREALTQGGLPLDDTLLESGNFDEASGYRATNALIGLGKFDGLFCASDMIALGALRALLDAGLRVPDDVALVGFDDMLFSATTHPPLTTVHQPIAELGQQAVQLLLSLIEGEPQQTQLVLSAHLIIRNTCGAEKIA